MSTVRLGGGLRRWFRTWRRGLAGVFDGGSEVSAAADPSCGTVGLQLTVWEQRL